MLLQVPKPVPGIDSKLAVVADVGRRAVRLGLTDHDGRLRPETILRFEPSEQSTISGALSAFGQRCELQTLPKRCAIAVSGAPVGDVISVTNSRWFVSRSGLTAMLQAPPLILNDFAAKAWAIGSPGSSARVEAIGGPGLDPTAVGTRCLIGVGSGLGVAVITRAHGGALNILSTEAGHCHFTAGFAEVEPVLRKLKHGRDSVSAEDLLSERGLVAFYKAVLATAGLPPRPHDVATIARLATSSQDSHAIRAAELFCRTLWYFAGNLALAYGAWGRDAHRQHRSCTAPDPAPDDARRRIRGRGPLSAPAPRGPPRAARARACRTPRRRAGVAAPGRLNSDKGLP